MLVREVLSYSSLAEVRGDWVRQHRWEQWILPDAPESIVEPQALLQEGEGGPINTEGEDHASRSLEHEGTAEYAPQEGEYTPHEYAQGQYATSFDFYPTPQFGGVEAYTQKTLQAINHHHHQQQTHDEQPGSSNTSASSSELPQDDEPNEDESEELESEESDVEIVLGKDINGSWTPEKKHV